MPRPNAPIQACVDRHPARRAIRLRLDGADEPTPIPDLARSLGMGFAQTGYHVRLLIACDLAIFENGGVVAVR